MKIITAINCHLFKRFIFITPVKQSPVMQQQLAEEVLCTENISYGGVISANTHLYSEVGGAQEDDDYV